MSKKVAFITRHAVANYGSLLQAYATQSIIEELGHDAVCIDYVRRDELPENLLKTRLYISNWNKNALTRLIYIATKRFDLNYEEKKFYDFRREILKLTDKTYHSRAELEKDLPEADVYMTGSDQVWNEITYRKIDPVYFLNFVPDGKKKTAYAASFGGKSVKDTDKELIGTMLKRYDSISVREKSGVKIAEDMGAEANQVLDPTLLMNKKRWGNLIPNKKCEEDYVLVYQLQPNKAFEKYALEFAKRQNLKLLRISPSKSARFKTGKLICCPPVGEFLWYIENAKYFLTDSFHGTAFAINLNTPFIDILPNKFSERNRSILSLVGLEHRILDNLQDFSLAEDKIDFDKVNFIIEEERKKSIKLLRKMIEE